MGRQQLTAGAFEHRAARRLHIGNESPRAGRVPCFHASGVTLTEVVVAAGLLVIAIVPLLKALTIAQITERTIERKTHSLMLAQRELERVRAKSLHRYDDNFAETSRVLEGAFLCTVTDDTEANLRMVAVSVGLDQNKDGILSPDEIDVRLCTCLARRRPGPQGVSSSEQSDRTGLPRF